MANTATRGTNLGGTQNPRHVSLEDIQPNVWKDQSSADGIYVGSPEFDTIVMSHRRQAEPDLLGLTVGKSLGHEASFDDFGLLFGYWLGSEVPSAVPNYLFPITGEPTYRPPLPPQEPHVLSSQIAQDLGALYRSLSLAAVLMRRVTDEQHASGAGDVLTDENRKVDLVAPVTSARLGLANISSYDKRLVKALSQVLSQSRNAQQMDRRLSDALQDLREASEEAEDEGFPTPSQVALRNAQRLLIATFEMLPHRLAVYPTPDGEIAIHAKVRRGSSVLLLCESDGGGLCLVNINGQHRRKRYRTCDDVPDIFLEEALAELGSTL